MHLVAYRSDSFASAIEEPRPGVGCRYLKPLPQTSIDARLQRVVRRIALARAHPSLSKAWIKSNAVQLLRVEVSAGRQLMAYRCHIGSIHQELTRQLPLEAERPTFGVRAAKILLVREG